MGTRDNYEALWATDGGIYLGIPTDHTEGPPPERTLWPLQLVSDRMLTLLGPTGSGKSRRVFLVNIARLPNWSMVIVDVKGTLAQMTARHRARRGNRVIILNPFKVLGLGTASVNPVVALDPASDDFPDDALGIAEALVRIEGREPHFAQGAQEAATGALMYSRMSEPDGGTLAHVRSTLALPFQILRDEIAKALELARTANCEELATKLARFMDVNPENRELSSVLSTFQFQTRSLDSRPIKAALSGSDAIDFAEMKEHPTTIYLVLPPRRLSSHALWLRLMLTTILQPLMRDTRRGKCPIMFLLDEYYAIARGGLPVIEDNMAMMREYGIKLFTVLQDLTQARRLWDNGWETFIANSTLVAFAPQDVTTADYLSKRTGQTRKEMLSRTNSTQQNADGGRSRSDTISSAQSMMPLMLPQDLRNMDDGYAVIFSHKTKGTVRSYFPDPADLPDIAPLAALAP